jgi:hypothetical protein
MFFLKNKNTHYAKSSFPTPLLISVHTSLWTLNAVLKGLKHATSRGYNAWLVCDGKVIKSNFTLGKATQWTTGFWNE